MFPPMSERSLSCVLAALGEEDIKRGHAHKSKNNRYSMGLLNFTLPTTDIVPDFNGGWETIRLPFWGLAYFRGKLALSFGEGTFHGWSLGDNTP